MKNDKFRILANIAALIPLGFLWALTAASFGPGWPFEWCFAWLVFYQLAMIAEDIKKGK